MTSRLTLEWARRLTDAALDAAQEAGTTIVVAVVDAGGHLLSLARMEGTPFVLTEVAVGKAYTASSFGRPTHELMGLFVDRVQFTTSIQVATEGRFTLAKGGLPLTANGETVGGLAVSGGDGDGDLAVARAALAAEPQ